MAVATRCQGNNATQPINERRHDAIWQVCYREKLCIRGISDNKHCLARYYSSNAHVFKENPSLGSHTVRYNMSC